MPTLDPSLADGFIRLRYTGVTRPHTAIFPINPASPMVAGVEPTLETLGGGEKSFTDAVTDIEVRKGFRADTRYADAKLGCVGAQRIRCRAAVVPDAELVEHHRRAQQGHGRLDRFDQHHREREHGDLQGRVAG